MGNKKSHQQYVSEVAKINPDIEVIGQYIGAKISILHRCKIDGHEWMANPTNILNKKGCPMCAGNIQKTHIQYLKELQNINPNIIVIGQYIDSHTKILHKCKIDETEWYASPTNVLAGKGCPTCKQKRIIDTNRISQEEYINIVSLYHANIEVIGIYINTHTKILHKCKLCGHEWYITPHDIIKCKGCQICGDGISYPNKFMYSFLKQLNIEFIPEYSTSWSNQKRYDIYIPLINCIIENHGRQHYESCSLLEYDLQDEQRNDEYKKQIAMQNGIANYISIDCRKSEVEWIKKSIMNSVLPLLINFSEKDINWDECNKFATCSLIKNAAEYWNSGETIKQISKELGLHTNTIRRYLKQANNNGWCIYNPAIGHKRAGLSRSGHNHHNAKSVFCFEQRKIYKYIKKKKCC